jgi:hypothetical protein
MSVPMLALRRRRAMLDLDEGRFIEAERDLSAIIGECEASIEPSIGYEFGHALLDRATARSYLNRWEAALTDLDACEQVASGLSRFAAASLGVNIQLQRAKLCLAEQAPGYDPVAARSALAKLAATGSTWIREANADLAFRERDWQAAADGYDVVGDTLARQGWPRGAVACELQSGTALLELGRLDEAATRLQHAAAFLEARGPSDLRANAERQLARLHTIRGDADAAWARATMSLSLMEASVRSLKGLFDQQRYVSDKQSYYQHAFAAALVAGGETGSARACTIAERAKSFYLCQLVANADVPLFDGVDPADISALAALEDRLDLIQGQIGWSRDDEARRAALDEERTGVAAERDGLLARIMRDHPRWASARTPAHFDLARELDRLPPGWSMLSMFWLGGTELHLFLAEPGSALVHRAETWSGKELETLRSSQAAIRSAHPGALFVLDRVIPESIAHKILPPDILERIAPGQRLLVSPHGPLRAVPLQAVRSGGARPLLEHAVQYIPSLALLGLATPRPSGTRVLLLGCESDGFNNPPLPGVPGEIATIERAWAASSGAPVDSVMLSPTSRPGAGAPALERWGDYQVIHLACHGELDPEQPLDAALLLGGSAVRASELFSLELRAETVVLSACDLGGLGERLAGVRETGDEWLGFTMPLLSAGARSILVSLWKADDATATRLMPAFHEHVRDGLEPADGLRDALAVVADGPEAFWSNWYLVGFPAG